MPFAIHLTQSAQVWASTGRQTRCSILATKVRYIMAMALFLMYIGLKNLVLDLILALQTFPTARLLPSPNNRGTLFGDLSRFNAVVDSCKWVRNQQKSPFLFVFRAETKVTKRESHKWPSKAIQIKQQPQADRYHKPYHRRGR